MTNHELFSAHLALVGQPAVPEDLSFYAPDVTLRLVNAPEGHTKLREGAHDVAAFMVRITQFFRDFSIRDLVIHDTAEGFVAEYHGDSVCIDTDRPYNQDYIAVVGVENGQIKWIREYYDAIRVLRAIGDLD